MSKEQKAEINKKVMDRYPITKDERRGCSIEIGFRNKMRMEYKKKLIADLKQASG